MKVFKTCILIARHCLGMLISFCILFIVISVLSSQSQAQQMEAAFQGEVVPYTIINRDTESPLIQGLRTYLAAQGPEEQLPDDPETLQEALFYEQTSYIIIIPEGFTQSWPEQKLEVISRPGSVQTYFMDNLTDSYFMQVRLQGYPAQPEKAVANALESLSQTAKVEKQRSGNQQEASQGCQVYYRIVGYALLVLIFQFISTVQIVFSRKEIRMRHSSAPISPRRFTMEIGAYGGSASVIISLILMVIGYVMNRTYFAAGGWQLTLLVYLNVLVFMLVAIGVSVLCSQFTQNQTVQSVISNFVGLSLSFLGGLFVPMELLSTQMQQIGQLMPTYWYVDTFEKIRELGYYTAAELAPVWQGMLIQLAYAAVFFCAAMVVAKYKRMEG